MAHQKRGSWWGVHPEKGKKAFDNESEAVAWEGGSSVGRADWYGAADAKEEEDDSEDIGEEEADSDE